MVKTTVYLPDHLKRRLARLAARERRREAEIIRSAVEEYTAARERPRPRLPLFDSGAGDLAERADDYLAGFGER